MMKFREQPSNRSDVHDYAPGIMKRISWGSIFAATLIVLSVQITLVLLGMAVGFSTFNPATEENPFGGLGAGAYLWWTVSFVVSLFIGGWIAGRLSGIPSRLSGALHGLVSWSLASVFTVFLLTSAVGSLIGGAFGMVSNVMGGTAQAIGAVAPGAIQTASQDPGVRQFWSDVQNILMGQGAQQDQQLSQAVQNIARDPSTVTSQDRQSLINSLSSRTDMSQSEAGQSVDQWIAQYRSARQTASNIASQVPGYAEAAAGTLALASFFSFLMMLLGAVAAGFGGAMGAPFDDGTKLYYVEEPAARRVTTVSEREPLPAR